MKLRTVDDLQVLLDDGAWLGPGAVAELLGINRQTVHRMLRADPPAIRFRFKPGRGQHRECNPEDVRKLLADRRRVYGERVVPAEPTP